MKMKVKMVPPSQKNDLVPPAKKITRPLKKEPITRKAPYAGLYRV